MSKIITETEIRSGRISFPAQVRDLLFPDALENTKTDATMVDETGQRYDVVFKVRKNRTKPEIMAKGGKNFVRKRNLKAADVLIFSSGALPGHFRVHVKRRPYPIFPATAEDSGDLSAPVTSPPAPGLFIGSDHSQLPPGKGISSAGEKLYGVKEEVKEIGLNLELTLASPPANFQHQRTAGSEVVQEAKPPSALDLLAEIAVGLGSVLPGEHLQE